MPMEQLSSPTGEIAVQKLALCSLLAYLGLPLDNAWLNLSQLIRGAGHRDHPPQSVTSDQPKNQSSIHHPINSKVQSDSHKVYAHLHANGGLLKILPATYFPCYMFLAEAPSISLVLRRGHLVFINGYSSGYNPPCSHWRNVWCSLEDHRKWSVMIKVGSESKLTTNTWGYGIYLLFPAKSKHIFFLLNGEKEEG